MGDEVTEIPPEERAELPILETKIALPRLVSGLVDRQRLRRRLDGATGAAVVLLSAPTGYGKTTAVRAWCGSRTGSLAWVTLDGGDNDPVRLWTYVATAVERARRHAASRALHLLSLAQGDVTPALDALLNGLATTEGTIDVILDDLHELKNVQALATVEYFVTRLPVNTRVVAMTRADPGIRLASLRSRGALVELRAADLAFTVDEAREMLVDHEKVPVTGDGVATLVRRTEGWPGGLYLAALWLRDLADPATAIREFAGNDRHVAAYLSGEVLDRLDADTRDFLIRTAPLGRFSAACCDEVLDRSGSSRRLAELERSNLFLIALDRRGEWYRYHSLFEELLLVELATEDPGAAVRIHQRASGWCRTQGLVSDAVRHAVAAGDHHTVADLLVDNHLFLFDRGLMRSVLHWIQVLPGEMLEDVPLLPCLAAVAAAVAREPAVERRRYVDLAMRARVAHDTRWDARCEVMLGLVHAGLVDRSVAVAVEWGERIAAIAADDVDDLVGPAHAVLAVARFYEGDAAAVSRAGRRALDHHTAHKRVPPRLMAVAMLSLAEAELGRRHQALSLATSAGALARESGLVDTWPGALVAGALAVAHELAGNLPEAERQVTRSLRLHTDVSPAGQAWALVVLARIRASRGRLESAGDCWQQARDVIDGMKDPGRLPGLLEAAHHHMEERRNGLGLDLSTQRPSEAETVVLRLLATELTMREIAAELCVSRNTVKSHAQSIYRKLAVSSRQDAVSKAVALAMLPGDSPG